MASARRRFEIASLYSARVAGLLALLVQDRAPGWCRPAPACVGSASIAFSNHDLRRRRVVLLVVELAEVGQRRRVGRIGRQRRLVLALGVLVVAAALEDRAGVEVRLRRQLRDREMREKFAASDLQSPAAMPPFGLLGRRPTS